jgi:predicted esterase
LSVSVVASALSTAPAAASSVSSCPWWFSTNESFFSGADLGSTSTSGEISNCRRITLTDEDLPTGTVGYQVIYRSKLETGVSVPVSGTVLVPAGERKGIISMATGTVGLADKIGSTESCAPSVGLPSGGAMVSGPASEYVEQGYVVAVTDYQGLRTPGAHLYLNGVAEGRAMIDMARAAQRIPGAGLGAKKVLYTGYSQGGHATLWAAQLTKSYAPELDAVGALAGGPPVNVEATRALNDGALASGGFAYIITAFQNAYPTLNLPARLSASGQTFVNAHANECSVDMVLSSGSQFRSWTKLWKDGEDPVLTSQPFRDRLDQNNVPDTKPTIPLYVFHGNLDGVVPFAPAKALADKWIDVDQADVTWRTISLGSHVTSHTPGRNAAASWVTARFS